MKVTKDGLLHYTLCGLDYVYLANGFTCGNTPYGPTTAVEDVEGLHRVIADDIIRNRAHMSGDEVRFLRKEMDLPQAMLALILRVDEQTVARWEKSEHKISGPADRLLRILYDQHIGGDEDVKALMDALAHLDDIVHGPRSFEEENGAWRLIA